MLSMMRQLRNKQKGRNPYNTKNGDVCCSVGSLVCFPKNICKDVYIYSKWSIYYILWLAFGLPIVILGQLNFTLGWLSLSLKLNQTFTIVNEIVNFPF